MTPADILPHVNATLNGATTVLLLIGFAMIRTERRAAHRAVMLGALALSGLFLASYLYYHATSPIYQFRGTGAARPVYYTVMISHVVLAMVAAPLVILTALRALKGTFERHRRLARWTLPLWLYVSASGIAVYAMLYHWPA